MVRSLSEELQLKAIKELNEDPNRVKENLNNIKKWLIEQDDFVAQKELQAKAIEELNENANCVEEYLKILKGWLRKQSQSQLTFRNNDDQWLLCFLRTSKFNLTKTKEKLENYYKAKTLLPHLARYEDPYNPKIQKILQANIIIILPQLENSTQPQIIILRYDDFDPNVMDYDDVIVVFFMMLNILMIEDDNYVISGLKTLTDCKCFPLRGFFKFTPSYLKSLQFCMQKAFPMRLKGLHYINMASIFGTAYNLIKTLLPKKLGDRLFIYNKNNFESLYEHIPQKLLPKEYGGNNSTVEEIGKDWKKKVESYADWFKNGVNLEI